MAKDLWINLPVKDLNRSKEFFTQIGFKIGEGPGNSPISAPLIVGEKTSMVMLFQQDTFKGITQNGLADTTTGTEVMFSFGADSKEEVDEMAAKVKAAGGDIFAPPAVVQGWMYGFAFCDPDGHRWNALYMDMSKMNG